MRRLTLLVVCAAFAGGCKDDKPDNTKLQTPNDAPIGAPKGMGGPSGGQAKGREAPLNP
ncbi:hypothetical protein [Urbifossiella limnaea]|uniref:Lipoprotein n=1 Tax=Urbifossiella limnaea TaxID=2528023 RepID=A0A517XZH3_9BACT|nr:hypothetical protein [Urbifossiella limnaea]QDU22907.1 hypothetical protein ETAA1_48960 [Urbifossiella limnaea]